MKLDLVEKPSIVCPKCGDLQPEADTCLSCGIVFRKFQARLTDKSYTHPGRPHKQISSFPFIHLTRLLQFIFLLSIAVSGWSYMQKDRLPRSNFYDISLLTDPLQTTTRTAPFVVRSNDIDYTIKPLYDYELNGVVVSYHNSDNWTDIYHHDSWQDYINVKDLCVIWGQNVTTEVYQKMDFRNSTWTCWASWPNSETGRKFKMQQLSNNHILAEDPQVLQAIMEAEPGDQIFLQGMLASYSHSNNFSRGSSTIRTDTGNGACETIFVEDFEILKKSNAGWRTVYTLAKNISILSLLGLVIMFFVSPVRPKYRYAHKWGSDTNRTYLNPLSFQPKSQVSIFY